MILRVADSQDRQRVIHLIDGVLREYGDEICLTGADQDLMDITGHYEQLGGAFVVLDDEGKIRGTHAVVPDDTRHDVCFLRRLYLEQALRGSRTVVPKSSRARSCGCAEQSRCLLRQRPRD